MIDYDQTDCSKISRKMICRKCYAGLSKRANCESVILRI